MENLTYEYWNEQLDDYETFEVEYKVDAGEPESRSGHPDNWYEGSADEIEILKVTDEYGADRLAQMDKDTFEDIEDKCWQEVKQYEKDYKNGLYI